MTAATVLSGLTPRLQLAPVFQLPSPASVQKFIRPAIVSVPLALVEPKTNAGLDARVVTLAVPELLPAGLISAKEFPDPPVNPPTAW